MTTAAAWRTIRPPIRAQYRPDETVLRECRSAGEALAEHARQAAAGAEQPPAGAE